MPEGFKGDVELYPAALEGWRYWKVERDRLLPIGIGSVDRHTTPWIPGLAKKAVHWPDDRTEHAAPQPTCGCGYWSYRYTENSDGLKTLLINHGGYIYSRDKRYVAGKVRVWGRVVVGTLGYRSEYAYPALLLIPEDRTEEFKPIVEAYHVETVEYSTDDVQIRGRMAIDVPGLPPRGASRS